jgi:hypothetical protein
MTPRVMTNRNNLIHAKTLRLSSNYHCSYITLPMYKTCWFTGYSENKAFCGSSSPNAGDGVWSSWKRHGGEREKMQPNLCGLVSGCLGDVMPHEQGEHSRWPKFWRPTLMTSWWSLSKPAMAEASSTSMWRPLFELAAAPPFLSVPSGVVPGTGEDGRRLSSCLLLRQV